MKEVLRVIVGLIDGGGVGALASIITGSGSLPMSRRSKMLVLPEGTQRGTVGGGCLEADVYAIGRQAIRTGDASLHRFTLTEEEAGAEGLNCGGTVEILVEPVGRPPAGAPADEAMDVWRRALEALEAREETVMITAVAPTGPSGGAGARVAGRALVGWRGLRFGSGCLGEGTSLAARAIEEALGILGQDRAIVLDGEPRLFLETVSLPPTLFLFGGGHVSLAVARVARAAGFRVVVVDDRAAFANPDRFPEAEQTVVLPMATALSRLPIGKDSYIVAVTRGHQHDEPVIEQAIGTDAAYIGMIGSRRKVALMWKRLKDRGASEAQLARVHAPIGLAIGADSPGEIAVSIVAQLISVRRGAGRGGAR